MYTFIYWVEATKWLDSLSSNLEKTLVSFLNTQQLNA